MCLRQLERLPASIGEDFPVEPIEDNGCETKLRRRDGRSPNVRRTKPQVMADAFEVIFVREKGIPVWTRSFDAAVRRQELPSATAHCVSLRPRKFADNALVLKRQDDAVDEAIVPAVRLGGLYDVWRRKRAQEQLHLGFRPRGWLVHPAATDSPSAGDGNSGGAWRGSAHRSAASMAR